MEQVEDQGRPGVQRGLGEVTEEVRPGPGEEALLVYPRGSCRRRKNGCLKAGAH